ncbi:hypothetical protein ACO0LO_26555 [Undibacterium sp. TJN25]|uniref:hypothetical protein n=1 Tax=Undibacterium sp. TJN25 TaxID=3413056 RepID=UPI003BF0620B
MGKFRLILASALFAFGMQASVLHAASPLPTVGAFGPDSLRHILDSHRGQPFVLVLWSLDCTYCQASMATLAKTKNANRHLQVVTLLTEQAQEQKAVKLMYDKLGKLQTGAGNWAFDATPPEQLRYTVDPAWHGELPRSYWYHADGSRTAYSGVITASVIQKMQAKDKEMGSRSE